MTDLKIQPDPLRRVLLAPEVACSLSLTDWDRLVQQGRATGLLARVAALLDEAGLLEQVHKAARGHLLSVLRLYRAHCEDIRIEVEYIRRALEPVGLRPALLKGAAYLAAGDRACVGRLFGDVDIFIARDQLAPAEEMLQWQGWESEKLSPYDEAYYRRWMHEIPPMAHRSRGIALDVHHTLLPLTSRVQVDAGLLAQALVPSQIAGVDTLAPMDRILHSAAHLLLGGEFDNAYRDMSDLNLLLREHVSQPQRWRELVERALVLGLGRVLGYALQQQTRLFGLVPPYEPCRALVDAAPSRFRGRLMDALFARALVPPTLWYGEDVRLRGQELAFFLLYVRSHYLKMPLPMLLRHLLHKAVITPFEAVES